MMPGPAFTLGKPCGRLGVQAMNDVNPKVLKLALAHCDTMPFERYVQTMLGAIIGHTFKPLGGHKDGGADGFVDADILEDVSKPTIFFQASMELNVEGKITKTVRRLQEVGRTPRTLYYASSRPVPFIDKLEVELRVHPGSFGDFTERSDHESDGRPA